MNWKQEQRYKHQENVESLSFLTTRRVGDLSTARAARFLSTIVRLKWMAEKRCTRATPWSLTYRTASKVPQPKTLLYSPPRQIDFPSDLVDPEGRHIRS